MGVILKEIKYFWKVLIALVAATLGTTLSMMGLPTMLANIIDEAVPTGNTDLLYTYIGYMIVLVCIEIACGVITAKTASVIAMGVGRNMRTKIFAKVQNFSQEEVDKFSVSSLITRTNNDILQVQTFLQQALAYAIMAPLMCVIGVVLAMQSSPELSTILFLVVPVLLIILVIIGKQAVPLSQALQVKLDRMNMVSREKLTGVRVVRAFGTQKFEEKKFDGINEDFTKTNKKLQNVVNSFIPIVILVVGISVALILIKSYLLYKDGAANFTAGEIMAIIQYIMFILVGVMMLTMVVLLLPRAASSAQRAREVLKSENKIKNPEIAKNNEEQKGYLEFRDVSFTYAGADVPALKHLSFSAKPGETTAIIGGTGMGKTTIVNLIPRMYDVTEGQVLVDGIDVRDYDISALRDKIGYVPQKANLFKGTIESNLMFGDKDATEERIEKAVKIAQSYDFVSGKEGGFNAPVSQGGSNFSGGQKQRLCIARAVVRKPEIYIFDDSFSALDFKTDKNLRAALSEETGTEATTVIVAQRVSTIKEADRIIVIENGDIVGIGKHHELLASCDVYREICSSQMSKEEMEK